MTLVCKQSVVNAYILAYVVSGQCFAQYTILKISKFSRILFAFQPAVRPGFTSAMASVFSHNKGNRVKFTKPMFQLMFIH